MDILKNLPALPPGTFTAELSGKKCQTLRGFYGQVARAMRFPDYFGKNLDALEECLADLSWLDEKRAALIVRDASFFMKKEKAERREALLDLLKTAAENPGEKPFSVHFLTDD